MGGSGHLRTPKTLSIIAMIDIIALVDYHACRHDDARPLTRKPRSTTRPPPEERSSVDDARQHSSRRRCHSVSPKYRRCTSAAPRAGYREQRLLAMAAAEQYLLRITAPPILARAISHVMMMSQHAAMIIGLFSIGRGRMRCFRSASSVHAEK